MNQQTNSIFQFKVYALEQKSRKAPYAAKSEFNLLSSQHERHGQPKISGALSSSSTELVSPLLHHSAAVASPSQSTQKFFCSACRKRFTNEATFSAHEQSDKHKKAVRAASSSASQPKAQALSKSPGECHPVVNGALANIKKAQALMHKDPSVAATVFWNIAKDISQYGDVSVTRTSLEKAKFCLDAMNDDPGLRGTKGSPAFWSPRSLLKTSLDCDMALARLEADTDIAESSERYKTGLCQFLGIERSKLDYVSAKNRNPQILEKMAAQIVLDIPRKFSKEEDVEQAFAAMKEVASALVAFSGGKASGVLATQGLAVYFVAYCFALSRDRCGDAFDCLKDIIRVYRFFSIPHMASECAALVIRQHASELGSRALVARSIVDSILASDLIRARELLGAYNARSAEPWSVYLNKLVEKLIGADVPWLSELAFAEWQQIAASQGAPSDPSIVDVVLPALEKHILAPYILYEPSLDTLNGNVD